MNTALIDGWTLVHIASGVAAALFRIPRTIAYSGAFAYEIVEQGVERTRWGQQLFQSSGPESLRNAASDLVVFAAGYELTRWLRR